MATTALADQVILIRLRTGHNRMNAHMYSKLKIGQTDRCPWETAQMTSKHLPLEDNSSSSKHGRLHVALKGGEAEEGKKKYGNINERLL